MSLTSYRAAPPRASADRPGEGGWDDRHVKWVLTKRFATGPSKYYFDGTPHPPATMPGDDLLFHRLSDSTIGAVGFHGRVRDGIGWDTDAMATRQ